MARQSLKNVCAVETKKKMGAMRTGNKNPMYGHRHSEKTRQLISQKVQQAWKDGKFSGKK